MRRISNLFFIVSCICQLWLGRAQRLRSSVSITTKGDETKQHLWEDAEAPRHLKKKKEKEEKEDHYDDEAEAEPPNHGPPSDKVPPAEVSGDRRNVDNVLANFQMAKARLLERIKGDYGEDVFETVFMDNSPLFPLPSGKTECSVGRNAFLSGSDNAPKAWARSVRKMKINLLQYLIEGKVQDFVWATAGNDAAAGHGNFFDEQYTMVLQDRARDLFYSVGLDLVARPYATGGATSAPEVAGCAKEIFGTDVDLITWDFAMTDGRWFWRMEFFAHRVMRLKNHPTLLVLQAGTEPVRREMVDHLTEQGMAALRQDDHYVIGKHLQFPDSRGLSDEEIMLMPKHVRYFRCGYGIENGIGCIDNKFTKNGTCDERPYRTNWHKGWKWHAYQGNLYALFLMEVMEDALHELSAEGGDYVTVFQRLEAEEAADFRMFEEEADLKYEKEWATEDLSAEQFYIDPTYCHTANLPAQTRYLGYVFDEQRYDSWFSYAKGFTFKALRQNPRPEIMLGYQPRAREEKKFCNQTLTIDSRDFFFATDRYEGFQKIVIPNDAEIAAYDNHPTSGIIAVCAQACSFECAGSPMLSPDHIHKDKAKMTVNGEPVGSVVKFDNCFLLRRESGELNWSPNSEKKYEIAVQVVAKNKHFRFSSFIIW